MFHLLSSQTTLTLTRALYHGPQNGDYNKPIPAQYKENLNHGVSAVTTPPETPKTLQWVNCQMLLCKKCNNNQTLKIKQLASFIPRDDVSDESALCDCDMSQINNAYSMQSVNI